MKKKKKKGWELAELMDLWAQRVESEWALRRCAAVLNRTSIGLTPFLRSRPLKQPRHNDATLRAMLHRSADSLPLRQSDSFLESSARREYSLGDKPSSEYREMWVWPSPSIGPIRSGVMTAFPDREMEPGRHWKARSGSNGIMAASAPVRGLRCRESGLIFAVFVVRIA